MPGAVELLSILRSNAPVRELFGDLFGGAPRLAQIVVQRPHVLDAAIDPGRVAAIGESLDEARMTARVEAFLAAAGIFEETLDRARDFAAEESFLIGVRLLSAALDPERAGRAYSALAQALLEALLTRVGDAFALDHGRVKGGRVAVLAMGKFGSREMTAASDLDLIVIYDFPADAGESDGARPLGAGGLLHAADPAPARRADRADQGGQALRGRPAAASLRAQGAAGDAVLGLRALPVRPRRRPGSTWR